MIKIRKEMRSTGFEQKWIESYTKGMNNPAAKTNKLPEGLQFEYVNANNSLQAKMKLKDEYSLNKQQANQALDAHTIIAKDANGNYVGHISWNEKTGKIQLVNVSPEMQRRGIATKLFQEAENTKGSIKPIHEIEAKNLSPEGAAWKAKMEQPVNQVGLAIVTERAKRALALVVEERAVSQILQYVDNPLVRTQLAFGLRNFARFYRATEDFYRRMYRVVRYNPEGIVKAALTYEGITHSGWIQQDDQGESYFVYPAIGPVYNAVQNALTGLGIGGEFKTPFPIEFGAKVKMLTPSLNPDSLLPTFSGPIAGISVATVSKLLSGIGQQGAADTIKGYALGKYAVDQPTISLFLPAHINRLYGAMSEDDRNSQYASAWRKAVTYLEASGHGLPKKYDEVGNLIPPTPGEQEAYRLAIKNTTQNVLAMRFIFGFLAPASPSVNLKSDMAQWISDNGRANFKQTWNNLISQYNNDYDAAMAKWVELYPNQIAFTVTESEKKSIAPIKYAQESGYFVDQNKDLFKKYPLSANFLIPHKSGFSWDAYKTMKDMGLLQNKRVDDYLREVQTAADLQEYYARKNQYEESLATSVIDYQRTQSRQEFDKWKEIFFAGRPLVKEELSQGSQKAIKRLETLNEFNAMLDANLNIRPETERGLRAMRDLYVSYKNERASLEAMNMGTALVDSLKASTIIKMQKLSIYNENTKAAYDVLFSRLPGIGD